MTVIADRERCVSAGQCVLAAPAVFDQTDDEGLVVILQTDPPPDLMGGVRDAIRACPAQVLALVVDH